MAIYTSYFARYRGDKGVSIALYPIRGYSGRRYPPLYPSKDILSQWKTSHEDEMIRQKIYIERYYNEVLSALDPRKVVNDLGDAVLLCYEKPNTFCHRRLVASWLEASIGIIVPELTFNKED